MIKKLNKKGFTLADLLIVVAIIGVLVAISIPIFTGQLQKSRLAANQANARTAYAAALAKGILDDTDKATPHYKYIVASSKIESLTLAEGASLPGTHFDTGSTPQDWTLETKDGILGAGVAKVWYVSFAVGGEATYSCDFSE